MCLEITDDAVAQIAEEDIVCYKMLRYTGNYFIPEIGGTYHAPCYRFEYKAGVQTPHVTICPTRITAPNLKGLRYNKRKHVFPASKRIIEDGYHSFVSLKDAYASIHGSHVFGTTYRVYKCIIPKDATYYSGRHADTLCANYVSSSLIMLGEAEE